MKQAQVLLKSLGKEAGEITIRQMRSVLFRATMDPERFSGSSCQLIPGRKKLDVFGSAGFVHLAKTLTVDGTYKNSMSKTFSGNYEGYPSEEDRERAKQTRYNGFGLAYELFQYPDAVFPHNEVNVGFSDENLFALCTTSKSMAKSSEFLKFAGDVTKKLHLPTTPKIMIYNEKDGSFTDAVSDKPIIFDPLKILTTGSWNYSEILQVMEENYDRRNKEAEAARKLEKKLQEEFAVVKRAKAEALAGNGHHHHKY